MKSNRQITIFQVMGLIVRQTRFSSIGWQEVQNDNSEFKTSLKKDWHSQANLTYCCNACGAPRTDGLCELSSRLFVLSSTITEVVETPKNQWVCQGLPRELHSKCTFKTQICRMQDMSPKSCIIEKYIRLSSQTYCPISSIRNKMIILEVWEHSKSPPLHIMYDNCIFTFSVLIDVGEKRIFFIFFSWEEILV